MFDAIYTGTETRDPQITDQLLHIRFYTNDAWKILRGVAEARGFPLMLMNRYSRGIRPVG